MNTLVRGPKPNPGAAPNLGAALDHAVEGMLRHDRLVVLGGLFAIAVLAWIYLVVLAMQMPTDGGTPGMTGGMSSVMGLRPWTASDAVLMFIMWSVMMVGMMVPSATPMILLYAAVLRKHAKQADDSLVPTSAFFAGYVTVWIGFSLAATTLQWGLEQAALLSPMMVNTGPLVSGLVLIIAGIYQWTPYKDTCLRHCRSPAWFLSTHWRQGTAGAYIMGLEHGAYCLGCCWMLMALLFVGGVMNLLCVAAITIFVLIEKVTPYGRGIGRGAAIVFVLLGIAMIMDAAGTT